MNRDFLQEMLSRAIKRPAAVQSVVELEGDASTRKYFRITLEGEKEGLGGPVTVIMMRYPSSHVIEGELAFLNVHRYLSLAGISVPGIYLHMPEVNLLFLEDAGDTTLEGKIKKCGFNEEIERIYEILIDQVVAIQIHGTECLDDRAFPSRQSFDYEKLMWEMDFLAKWGFEHLESASVGESLTSDFLALTEPVIQHLVAFPLVLAHRDYHSRNIMVLDRHDIRILDFQDARMGNIYYDLASLLFDSYVTLPHPMRAALIGRYREQVRDEHFAPFSSDEVFMNNLFTMAIQRNLKALGTFFYMYYEKGDDRYLKHIPTTMDHLKGNPVLTDKYRRLFAFTMPVLTGLLDQIKREKGGVIEGNDPRRGPGDQTETSDF